MKTLTLLFLIPIIGIILICRSVEKYKEVSLGVSILTLMESVRLWFIMEEGTSDFQFLTSINLIK